MKIELRRAALTYQAQDGEVAALRDVTFGVADGEFVSIVGPSGCGKSTLLKTLNRMNDLVEGCRIDGRVLLDLSLIHISEPTRP